MNTLRFIVGPEEAGERLDRFLSNSAEDLSRSFLQKLICDGAVLADGKAQKASFHLTEGSVIEVHVPEAVSPDVVPQDIPLDIYYEDDDLLVVNKPQGLSVHPGPGHPDGTLVNALLFHCKGSLSGIGGVERPGIVHRIDKDTSGLLVICKNDRAHLSLSKQLAEHSVTRVYHGITIGVPRPAEGRIEGAIGRDRKDRKKMAMNVPGGKEAVTTYRVEEDLGGYAHCTFRLFTGRTHQIRVHMASTGHPLLGDPLYGPRKPFPGTGGQMLHAAVLGFVHPVTGAYMEFEAPLPESFTKILEALRNQC